MLCSELVGRKFYYNGSLQTMTKTDYGYCRYGIEPDGSFSFGVGVTGNGVDYYGDEQLPQGSSSLRMCYDDSIEINPDKCFYPDLNKQSV